MNVLMLGWEYPPHISGGLGVACEGLTRGLSRQSVDMTFVVPRLYGGEAAGHMHLVDPHSAASFSSVANLSSSGIASLSGSSSRSGTIEPHAIPAFLKPYWGESDYSTAARTSDLFGNSLDVASLEAQANCEELWIDTGDGESHYGNDLFHEVGRYTARVVSAFKERKYDLIHAHDWMTYPAAIALSELTGAPAVLHVHSLEVDRSGAGKNQEILAYERYGLERATRIIAVSHYTKSVIEREFSIPEEKISVVHNGVYRRDTQLHYEESARYPGKVVLFLGRITFQKGPDYFVRAAAKVVPHIKDVLFVMAGSGDMLPAMKKLVIELGLENHFAFPGFVRGEQFEEMFSLADLYIMPSVSEPFGISALEAISFDTPVLLSKQSGVSEVIDHALKFDFWDVDRLADLTINALEHAELRDEMVSMARRELAGLRWDAAAQKTVEVYNTLV